MDKVERVADTHTEPTAAQIAEIVGSVTVLFNPDNSVTLIPDVGKVNRLAQTMIWTLVAPEGTTFASTGIIFAGMQGVEGQPPPSLPDGFTTFPGTLTRLNDVQIQAQFATVVPHGDPMQQYRYDIWVDQGGGPMKIDTFFAAVDHVHNRLRKIDPDMENEPQP